jgi:outer membrane protein TolC
VKDRRPWPKSAWTAVALALGSSGCVHLTPRPRFLSFDPPETKVVPAGFERAQQAAAPEALPLPPPSDGPDLSGAMPVDVFIRQALEENRTVRAARYNVMALRYRVPQVTALDDPVISNTIFPIPSVAPQFSLMGYMPYDALLAQQFPWFGTLKLRGLAAEQDVKVALFELAAAQLDAVAAVKRAYCDLYFSQRALDILTANRTLATDFLEIARQRYRTATATQTDVLRSESAASDIDRERESALQGLAEARAELARQIHAPPDAPLAALHVLPLADVPAEIERLQQLAVSSRPELQGRLAAIARDERGVELARKRYYPNVSLGVVYQDMQKTNAVTPQTASGMPNVGLFVGFNLPVYHKKLAAGVCEAQARAAADAMLYESERDEVLRDVGALFAQARARRNVLELLRTSNLPRSRQVLDAAASDYKAGNIDSLSLLAAWRDLLQVELQIAQAEADLGKALAALERAVGVQLNEHPPAPPAANAPTPPTTQPVTPASG